MNISELHAKADRLEQELQETRNLLARETHDPETFTADLARTRAYAFNAAEELLNGQAAANNVELRPVRRVGHPPKPPNDIIWMPQYARHLANPVVTAVARRVLDDHLRIAQLHPRIIATDAPDGTPGGFGSVKYRGRADSREWHTDWPHDLSAYGSEDPEQNVGCIRQPFPDVAMCLVMIWYLTDVDENSGGTW